MRLNFLILLCLLAVPFVSSWGVADKTHPVSLDGNAIVHKMIATYKNAQTVQETSEVKMTRSPGGNFTQSTKLKFKPPNLVFLSSQDPTIGTYQGYCNGKSIVVYNGALNAYIMHKSPNTLRQTIEEFERIGKKLLGAPISQVLSPISFSNADTMPTECKQFQLIREENVEGKQAFVVHGQADSGWLFSLFPIQHIQYDQREITLWIDKSRYVLLKASCNISWHINVKKTAQTPEGTASSKFQFVEVHRGIVFNEPLHLDPFIFEPPKGATDNEE